MPASAIETSIARHPVFLSDMSFICKTPDIADIKFRPAQDNRAPNAWDVSSIIGKLIHFPVIVPIRSIDDNDPAIDEADIAATIRAKSLFLTSRTTIKTANDASEAAIIDPDTIQSVESVVPPADPAVCPGM